MMFSPGWGFNPWAAEREMIAARIREEQARILRNARTAAARFDSAEEARKAGNIRLASMLYLRITSLRPETPHTKPAKDALNQLAAQGRPQLVAAESKLEDGDVVEALNLYSEVAREFEFVPGVGDEAKSRLESLEHRREYAAIIKEEEAGRLWEIGRELEANGEQCCAYLLYERASELRPAVSARRSAERMQKLLAADAGLKASVERCRTVRECHELYRKAELLVKSAPMQAREVLKRILDKAPPESEVHVAARQRLASLGKK